MRIRAMPVITCNREQPSDFSKLEMRLLQSAAWCCQMDPALAVVATNVEKEPPECYAGSVQLAGPDLLT